MPENGELKHDVFTDDKLPQRKLKTYGRQFTLSRKAFIDDDISLVTSLPARYAAAARKTINKQVWHTHNIVNGKPKSEFAGPDSSSVTLEAVLAAERGVRPRATLEKLEKACESGTVDYLYIGGKKVGTGKMKLESISETWDEIWNSGQLVKAKVSLTFSEY